VLLAVTLLVVALVLGWQAKRFVSSDGSTPTVPAWVEASSRPSPRASDDWSAPRPVAGCPFATRTDVTPQPPGKMAAGTLRIDLAQGGMAATGVPATAWVSWAYDVHVDELDHYYADQQTGWTAVVFLALLSKADGFTDLGASAELALRCWVAGGGEGGDKVTVPETLVSEATSVGGHAAWHVTARLVLASPSQDWTYDVADIYIVDLGAGTDHVGMYLANSHNIDPYNQGLIDQTLPTLTVVG